MAAALATLRSAALERRIFLVAAASLLPLALLSSITLVTAAKTQKARLLEAQAQTAQALSAAVDSQLGNVVASLDALASSPRLTQEDFAGLQQVFQELMARRPTWVNLVVSTPDAQQVMNASLPLSEERPSWITPGYVADAVRLRAPIISNLEWGPILQQHAFGVHLPVERDGAVRYVLTAVISPHFLLDLVKVHPVPDSGVVTIVDRDHRVVARSRDADQWLGRPVTGPLLERLRDGQPRDWVPSSTLDGTPVYSVYHSSAFSGWSAIIGTPRQVMDAPLRRSYLAFGGSFLVSVILGLLAAGRVGHTIVRPVRELESSAASVGRGEAPRIPQTRLPEVRGVGEALVSAHQQRERALERERDARRVAENASKAKDEFLAMLGHELRNPLAAIATASQLLERDRAQLAPRQASAAAIVSRQVRHMARMTDDLLDASRIVLGKIVLTRSRMDLAQGVQGTLAAMRNSSQLDRHEVRIDATPVWIDGDPTRIEQITLNLLANAAKYTPEGGCIRVEVYRDGEEAVLRVSDNGIGLDGELLARAFDLFVQGERSIDRSQGGLGVGLTLVRRLAELHGGTVQAESAGYGSGAAFTVRLPGAQPPATSDAPSSHQSPRRRLRIALIEDNDDVRTGLRMLLENEGHTVLEAADGTAGLALLRTDPALDVALVDIGLPVLDGLQVAQAVRSSGARCPVLIAMTGYGGEAERERGIAAGFDSYLVKPVDPEALMEMLQSQAARQPPASFTAS